MRYPSQLTIPQAADRALNVLGLTTADTLMSGRATAAVKAGLMHWGNAALWNWLLTSNYTTAGSGLAFQLPDYNRPTSFAQAFPGTTKATTIPPPITAADATASNAAATGFTAPGPGGATTGTEYRYYVTPALPSMRAIYNVRDMTQPRTLYYANKLRIDRANPDHTYDKGEIGQTPDVGTPIYWDWSINQMGQIRTLPVQDQDTTLLIRYFRHLNLYDAQGQYYLYWYATGTMVTDTVSGTAYSTANYPLDIPIMYEDYIVAFAASRLLKTHTDKLDLARDFDAYAKEGLAFAMEENKRYIIDEDVVLVPNGEDGAQAYPLNYENLTRFQVDSL